MAPPLPPPPPDELGLLIKSVPPAEMTRFLAAADTSGAGKTLLLRLLDMYRKQPEISRQELCKHLGIKSAAQLSNLKKRLFRELLDAGFWMRRRQNVSVDLSLMLEQLQWLIDRRLYKLAAKLHAEAVTKAKRYERYAELAALLLLESNMLVRRDYKRYRSVDRELMEALENAGRCQDVLHRIQAVYEQVKAWSYRSWLPIGSAEREGIDALRRELGVLSQQFGTLIANHTLLFLYFNTALATCLYMLDEAAVCSTSCEGLWAKWAAHPHLIHTYAPLFLAAVNTTLYNDFRLKDIAAAHRHLEGYEQLAEGRLEEGIYARSFQIIIFNGRLKLHHKTACYAQVKRMLEQDGERILSYATLCLSPPEALTVGTSMAISYFVLEQWEAAETYILEVKEQNRAIDREDILYFSLVFHLLILHEKKDWYRLDSAIEAAYHFLYARKKLRIFEKELCLFLKRTITTRNQDQLQELCRKFLLRLRDIIGKKQMPLYTAYFNFTGWLESKVRGIRYRDYVTEQSRQTDSTETVLREPLGPPQPEVAPNEKSIPGS